MSQVDLDPVAIDRRYREYRRPKGGHIISTHPQATHRVYRDVILTEPTMMLEQLQEFVTGRLEVERVNAYDVLDGARPSAYRVREVHVAHREALAETISIVSDLFASADRGEIERAAFNMLTAIVANERRHRMALARLAGYQNAAITRLLAFEHRIDDTLPGSSSAARTVAAG